MILTCNNQNTAEVYLKENLIAYIGNKRRLLPFLKNTFSSLIESDKSIKSAADIFAGSGSVSRLLKTLNLKVYSNDWEYYSYILNYAHLMIKPKELEKMFLHTGGVINTINILNETEKINDSDLYISKYYAPKDDNNPDIVNERMFYSQKNARRIDIIRHNIELMFKNKLINKKEYFYLLANLIYEAATHANTSGVFKAFHAGFGGRNKDALNRILGTITMKTIPLYDGEKCSVSMLDASEFSNKNKNKIFDILYLDPPYNQHQYGSNYHLLNTIAKWDKPEVNEKIYIDGKKTNKSAIRKDWKKTKSSYCYKQTAQKTLNDLLSNTNAKYIVMSYSTDGIIKYEELLDTLETFGSLNIVSSEYTRYRGAKRSIVNTKKNIEYLFVVNTKKKIKNTENNIKQKYIDEIRLILRHPFSAETDTILFSNKSSSIKINLKYQTHCENINDICQTLQNKKIEYIKLFYEYLKKYINQDTFTALNIYIKHFEMGIVIKDEKIIRYFGNEILSLYSSLVSKKSAEYLTLITKKLIDAISLYSGKDQKIIKQIKDRIEYNTKYGSKIIPDLKYKK